MIYHQLLIGLQLVNTSHINMEEQTEECKKFFTQFEQKLAVSKEKEKQMLSFVENLMWNLNYVQYKTLEIYAKLNE